MKNIDGYASVVFFSKTSEITSGKKKIIIINRYRYRAQYRFAVDEEYWNVGNKIFNTYVTINSIKYKLSDLLMETNILLKKGKNGEIVTINNDNILKSNIADNDLYGNVSLLGNYVYVNLAWVDLKLGLYSFVGVNNNENLDILNPELIIGIGETGSL